jgi:hypothetical protein
MLNTKQEPGIVYIEYFWHELLIQRAVARLRNIWEGNNFVRKCYTGKLYSTNWGMRRGCISVLWSGGNKPFGRWRQYAPLKRRSTIILHGSISQKTTLNFILAAVRTCNLTYLGDLTKWLDNIKTLLRLGKKVQTRIAWIRLDNRGGFLLTRLRTFLIHKRRWPLSAAELVSAS